jgi:hypothetical protein
VERFGGGALGEILVTGPTDKEYFATFPWGLFDYGIQLDLKPAEVWAYQRLLRHKWTGFHQPVFMSQVQVSKQNKIDKSTLGEYVHTLERKQYIVQTGKTEAGLELFDVSGLLIALAVCVVTDAKSDWCKARAKRGLPPLELSTFTDRKTWARLLGVLAQGKKPRYPVVGELCDRKLLPDAPDWSAAEEVLRTLGKKTEAEALGEGDNPVRELIEFFCEESGIPYPKKIRKMEFSALWEKPLLTLYESAGTVGQTMTVIREVVEQMRGKRLTVSNPKSIENNGLSYIGAIMTGYRG